MQQIWQHGYTAGQRFWLCLVVTLGLALVARATVAKECQRQTPLPADMHLRAPGPQVPETVARFAGAWMGAWVDGGSEALCHTLVVEEVLTNGFARVIYSVGTYAGWNIRQPNFWRTTGRIVDGALRFHLPVPERPHLAYEFAGEALQGTFKSESHVRLSRVADVSQVGCGLQVNSAPQEPPAAGPRDRLTAAELLDPEAKTATGPVHNTYFLPVGQVAPAVHALQGTLTIEASTMHTARHGCAGLATSAPRVTVAFFTHGAHLVPVVRDILQPPGTLIFSPGQVWSEPGDGGMSRAAFPYVVINPYNNGTHNGLATFLYDDTRVSALRFQMVQETATWAKFDSWGQAPLTYTPGPITNEAALREQFTAELAQQTPMRPWSALPVPSGTAALENFDGEAVAADISANGLIIDGVIYLRGCHTRYGPYPYCRHMRHGVFMDSFLKRQVGSQAHLWDMVVTEVYQPLGIFHAPMIHTQETDGGRGIPHLLHGLYPTIDDLAKLTTMLQNGGQHQGQQLLHAAKLAEALYQTDVMGLPTGTRNRFGAARYHLSFWSVPYRTGTGCALQIPYMAGYGGNLVVLLPNGISAFRFADGENFDLESMVLAGEAIRPFPCPTGAALEPPPTHQPRPLTTSELQAAFPGNTFYAGPLSMFPAADGMLYGTRQDDSDVGTWHVTPDGAYCRTWNVWDGRRQRCFTVYPEGESFALYTRDRWGKVVFRRVHGNPEGY